MVVCHSRLRRTKSRNENPRWQRLTEWKISLTTPKMWMPNSLRNDWYEARCVFDCASHHDLSQSLCDGRDDVDGDGFLTDVRSHA